MTDLGALGGISSDSYATGISADGSVIVGYIYNGTATHAFKYLSGTITDLGTLGDPLFYSIAQGVSADGSVIIGESYNGTNMHAFKYVSGTMTDLGALGDPGTAADRYSSAKGVSADGTTIIGDSTLDSGFRHAFKYEGGIMTDLGALGNPATASNRTSNVTGVSANGLVIVGYGDVDGISEHAFQYVAGAMTDLGALGDPATAYTRNSRAYGVSADGSVIFGESHNGAGTYAFKYAGGVMSELGVLSVAHVYSSAQAASADGSVIVGDWRLNYTLEQHAFKYEAGIMTDLGALVSPSYYSEATHVSANGAVVIGFSQIDDDETEHAFKYAGGVMTDLGALGDPATALSRGSHATGISADGSVIVGYSETDSWETHAFLYADNVMLDVNEWMASISGPAGILPMLDSLANMSMNGAHHRPMMSYDPMGKTSQTWVTGDFGARSRKSDSHTTTGEAGVSGTFGDAVAGVAVGYGAQNNDLLFGGSSNVSGQYVLGEVDYRLGDKESILSLTAIVGSWKSDTLRGYGTGGGIDYSHGTTDLNSASVRVRVDGPAWKGVGVALTPFASFTWAHASADAYSESGGSFDAQFDKQTHTSQEGRLGLSVKHVLDTDTTLFATAELIHRFDRTQSGFTGTDIDHGALPFSVAGSAITREQARFGFDIDHKLSADTLLSMSIHFTGIGEAPDVSGAISIRRAF
jgi:probable HAF family extracellular repeat protein